LLPSEKARADEVATAKEFKVHALFVGVSTD